MHRVCFRGIILQAESRKEYEEVRLCLSHPCPPGMSSWDSVFFLMSSTVDMCGQQHLQADLPDGQPRGNWHLPALHCKVGVPSPTERVCGLHVGRSHQAEPDGSSGGDSNYKLWEKTRKLLLQVTKGQGKMTLCGAELLGI